LAGGSVRPIDVPNPAPEWITERIWSEILTLESLESFKNFAQNFHTHLQDYKQIFDSSEPERLVHLDIKIDSLYISKKIFFFFLSFLSPFFSRNILLLSIIERS
jgi:hypothetical protein